jgi:glyceraldehyde-3-phosphate dehydrogenase (NADP+)
MMAGSLAAAYGAGKEERVLEIEPRVAGRALKGGERVEIRSPHDGRVAGVTRFAGAAELEAGIAEVVSGFTRLRRLASHERAAILRGVAERLRAAREELARLITSENAKPVAASRIEVDRAAQTFEVAAEEAKRIPGEILPLDWTPGAAHRWGMVRRFPVGPVLGITPFNFPLNLCAHKVAPALAAGCSVLVKPAPATPLTALRLGELVREAGTPEGACVVLPCANSLAPRLVEDERFALLSFTGSSRVGWELKARAGRKRVLLELGGNAAVVVHRDADLEAACRRIVAGGYAYSGQSCISVQRVYVHREVFDEFVGLLVKAVKALAVGDPFGEETVVSALLRPSDAERVHAWIEEARAGGAQVLAGGGRRDSVVEPTVLTGTRPDMKVVREEVFGPLVVVEPYDEPAAAWAAVNAGPYGLQAGLFTRDFELVWQAYEALEVGGVLVNEVPTWRAEHMPYGGVKQSGLGREGLRYAIEEMTEPRILIWSTRAP